VLQDIAAYKDQETLRCEGRCNHPWCTDRERQTNNLDLDWMDVLLCRGVGC